MQNLLENADEKELREEAKKFADNLNDIELNPIGIDLNNPFDFELARRNQSFIRRRISA